MSDPVPTVGRRVWFWPVGQEDVENFNVLDPKQPCDAGIVFVEGPNPKDFGTLVNLVVTDHLGFVHRRCRVNLLNPGQTSGQDVSHATWMPYQIGQSKGVDPSKVPYQERVVQERVVQEREEVEARLDRLGGFLASSAFETLPAAEQERLVRQSGIMVQYSDVLRERIAAF